MNDGVGDTSTDAHRLLAECVDELVFVTELGGRMLFANAALERLTGYTSADFQFAQSDNPFLHRDDAERVERFIGDFLASGARVSSAIENRFCDRWGQTHWFRSVLTRVRYEGHDAIQFVTRKVDRTIRALVVETTKSNGKHANGNGNGNGNGTTAALDLLRDYRILVQNAGDGIAKLDARGRFLFANQRFLEIAGRDVITLGHSCIRDLLVLEDRESAATKFLLPGRFETRLVSASGKAITVEVVVTPLHARGGEQQPQEIMALVRDVTEQRRMERELMQREKLESIGLLASGVAHDLNNFLAVVQTSRSMAEHALTHGEHAESFLQEIEQACGKARSLCTRLLAAGGQAPIEERTRVDLGAMVSEIVALLRPNLPRTISIVLKANPQRVIVRGDLGALQPLVMNLVTNAADAVESEEKQSGRHPGHTHAGRTGRIGIEIGACLVDDDLLARLEMNSGLIKRSRAAWIRVSDDGIGIDDATRAKMFDPFFTTKSVPAADGDGDGDGDRDGDHDRDRDMRSGHGLGLSSVLGAVHAHAGALAIESARGVGTTITVYLPIDEPESACAFDGGGGEAPSHRDKKAKKDRRHVLVVDDEPGLRRSLTLVLSAAGYDTIEASNGAEAIAIAQARGDDIALALIDQSMPEMGGFAAAREIKRTNADLPIIMMSGYSQQSNRQEGYEVIPKPFEPDLLIQSIRRASR